MSAAPAFVYIERTLLAELGLPQKKVRDLRVSTLVRGVDWQHQHNDIRYSAAGRAKLLALLHVDPAPAVPCSPDGLQLARTALLATLATQCALPGIARELADYSAPKNSPDPAPPAAAPGAAPGPLVAGAVHDLTVLRTYPRNRRIILATLAGALEARVRVKDSRKLRPGMSLKCSYIGGDLWELAQRLPRWPGQP